MEEIFGFSFLSFFLSFMYFKHVYEARFFYYEFTKNFKMIKPRLLSLSIANDVRQMRKLGEKSVCCWLPWSFLLLLCFCRCRFWMKVKSFEDGFRVRVFVSSLFYLMYNLVILLLWLFWSSFNIVDVKSCMIL